MSSRGTEVCQSQGSFQVQSSQPHQRTTRHEIIRKPKVTALFYKSKIRMWIIYINLSLPITVLMQAGQYRRPAVGGGEVKVGWASILETQGTHVLCLQSPPPSPTTDVKSLFFPLKKNYSRCYGSRPVLKREREREKKSFCIKLLLGENSL